MIKLVVFLYAGIARSSFSLSQISLKAVSVVAFLSTNIQSVIQYIGCDWTNAIKNSIVTQKTLIWIKNQSKNAIKTQSTNAKKLSL